MQAPAVVIQTSKYGAPFLVVGTPEDPKVIFLDGQYRFQSFNRESATNWSGLAIEGITIEVDLSSAIDMSGLGRSAGTMIRRGTILTIAAMTDDAFRHIIEIPVQTGLSDSSEGQSVAFTKWQASIQIGEERYVVWECEISVEQV